MRVKSEPHMRPSRGLYFLLVLERIRMRLTTHQGNDRYENPPRLEPGGVTGPRSRRIPTERSGGCRTGRIGGRESSVHEDPAIRDTASAFVKKGTSKHSGANVKPFTHSRNHSDPVRPHCRRHIGYNCHMGFCSSPVGTKSVFYFRKFTIRDVKGLV